MNRWNSLTPLLFIGAGLLAVILFTGGGSNDSEDKISEKSSIYNPNPQGMKGFYLTLKSWQPDIRRLTRPLYSLTEEVQNAGTLVIANPIKPLSPMEQRSLDAWIDRGGLVVLMKADDWAINQSGYHEEELSDSFRNLYGITSEEAQLPLTLYPEEGSGMLMVLPFISNNQNLKDIPESFIPLIQEILDHAGPIYFDEYHLNLGNQDGFAGPIIKFMKTRWGWVILHIALVFLASLFLSNPIPNKKIEARTWENSSMKMIAARGLFLENLQAKEFCQQAIDQYNKRLKAERKG